MNGCESPYWTRLRELLPADSQPHHSPGWHVEQLSEAEQLALAESYAAAWTRHHGKRHAALRERYEKKKCA